MGGKISTLVTLDNFGNTKNINCDRASTIEREVIVRSV